MRTCADKISDNKSGAIANRASKQNSTGTPAFQFADNSPAAIAQKKLQEVVNDSPRVQQLKAYQAMADDFSTRAALGKENGEEESLQGKSAPLKKEPRGGDGSAPVQMRTIPNITVLKAGIKQSMDAGDPSLTISKNSKNLKALTRLYTPGTDQEDMQTHWLGQTVGNRWREGWFDRVDQRVQEGSQRTIGDAQFWAQKIKDDQDAEAVEVTSVELLGDELHDAGLGPAKVWFLIEQLQTAPSYMSAVIKPEDRSIEKAILGSGDSIATNLNQHVEKSRRVKTLNMDTDANHGTIMEFVSSSITSMAETTLRKLKIFESEDTVNVETIGFALLTGLYDLHRNNIVKKGGAPVLIDADVAARPQELINGPSDQEGFTAGQTQQVRGQIEGNHAGSSHILQYAIDHPDLVIGIVTNYIGNHKARTVPVHTGSFIGGLQLFVHNMQHSDPIEANKQIEQLTMAVPRGIHGSPGLIGEVGEDTGNFWNFQVVESAIKRDFDKGVVPHFQYQPSTGRVFLHNTCIWQGQTLAQALAQLRARLLNA
jgi:hypothetical protein